jgi:hypothetical protein
MAGKPSYVRKADWAEKHLWKLTDLTGSFMKRHPYTVSDPIEDKRQQRFVRLEFTEEPDPDIALIAGDVLYNLRAAFDYLIASLVPRSYRSKVLCPILHEPVWEIPTAEGENAERTKNRQRWNSLTNRVSSDAAITALKGLMPLDSRARPPKMHPLDVINWLSNKDRHQQLSVIAWGLGDAQAKVVLRGGPIVPAEFEGFDFTYKGFSNNASIPIGPDVVYVKLKGTPVVVIRISENRGNIPLPLGFWMLLEWLRHEAIAKLEPYSMNNT